MMSVACLTATAQTDEREINWLNVTVLHFAASGSTDRSNALQQYLLIDNAVIEQHPELNEQFELFREEYAQRVINQVVPEAEKLLDESLEQLRKVMKEHPELAGQLKEQLKEAEAQDAQTALVRRNLGNAQIELSRAQNESVSLNESDKTGTLSAIGKTMGQLFTGDWGRMAEAKTEAGDAIRRDAAKRAAAAELKVGELQEQLRKSEAQAAELRREAERLREKQGKVGGALDAIRVEDQTALGANLRAQSAADRAVDKRLAAVEKDEATIAQGSGRVAALKRQIAAVEAQKSSAISADAKEQMDAEMARQALASFDSAGHRRNGTGVQARRGELEADVARETQEANRSRAQLQSTLATLAATLKGLNADLKKVEREVDAATKRQNAVNEEAPAA